MKQATWMVRWGGAAALAASTPLWAAQLPPAAWMMLANPNPSPMSGAAAKGSSSAGYLGVDVRDIAPEELSALKLRDTHGAEIVLVDHDAPAGKAGLREHDVVLQLNGQAIDNRDQIRRLLHDLAPGRVITLIISRNGQQMTVNTQISTREAVEREAWQQHLMAPEEAAEEAPSTTPASDPPAVHAGNSFIGSVLMSSSYTGAMLEKMPAQLASYFGAAGGHGLLVSSVKPNSPASAAGMQAGDVVVQANERPVTSSGDWSKAIKSSKGRPLTVVVLRDKKELRLTLNPEAHKHSGLEFPALHLDQAPAVLARTGMTFLHIS